MSLRSLLAYPLDGTPRFDALLVGAGLHLLAVWLPLVPFVAVAGYLLRVLAATAEAGSVADAERPGWRPVGPLLADGLRAIATCVGYLAVPTLLLVVTLGGPLERVDPTGTTDGLIFIAGSTLVTLLALAVAYPLPAALAAVGRDRSLRAAVDRARIGAATRDAGYLVATLFAASAIAVVAGLYAPLNTVALGFVVAFHVEVVVAAALGAATGRAWAGPARGTGRTGNRPERRSEPDV